MPFPLLNTLLVRSSLPQTAPTSAIQAHGANDEGQNNDF